MTVLLLPRDCCYLMNLPLIVASVLVAVLLLSPAIPSVDAASFPSNNNLVDDSSVLLQAFEWDSVDKGWFNQIKGQVSNIADSGFTHVWFPPPSASVAKQGYMPSQWYNLNSQYCTQNQLIGLVSDFKNKGVHPVADIVINHRCGDIKDESCGNRWVTFSKPSWGPGQVVENDWTGKGSEVTVPDWCHPGNPETTDNFYGAPDVDHSQEKVQTDVKNWLNWLQTHIGFEGWRFDMVKGYLGSYCSKYIQSTWGDSYSGFSVGEYYDSNQQNVEAWIDSARGNSFAFDFPFHYTLKGCVQSDNYSNMMYGQDLAGLLGSSKYKNRAVTFLDNHDTYRPESREPLLRDPKEITRAYAVLLTHPGLPSVFWPHWLDPNIQSAVKNFINFRNEMKITPTSPIYVDKNQEHLYVAYIGANREALVKVGSEYGGWKSPPDYKVICSGDGYALFKKEQ